MCIRIPQPRAASALDARLRIFALAGLLCLLPSDGWTQGATSTPPAPPASEAPLPPDDDGSNEGDDDPMAPGEAFLTRFSGTVEGAGGPVINREGIVGSVIDLGALGAPGDGRRIFDATQRLPVVADEVGQVFGVAVDDAERPSVYLTATSLFGLHLEVDSKNWMPGQWGEGGGPGTVYRMSPASGLLPEAFTDITLDGRANTGAALGNIAYDRFNKQLFVTDLETGMIHRIAAADGKDLGHYDHGVDGRASFTDAATGARSSLPQVSFDPETGADIEGCGADFSSDPECWNYADFRRRVFGVAIRKDTEGNVRLYYSVWGSDGFGDPDWDKAGDDRRNSVWSIRLRPDGGFDTAGVRREYILPAFFANGTPNAGLSRPVADIAFEACGRQTTMLVAERGSVRNLGLHLDEAFAFPHESRVLRYGLAGARWALQGTYEIGFYDRANEGDPRLRSNAAGGVAFGYGYDDLGNIDLAKPNATVWATGDTLCGPGAACFDVATGGFDDESFADGLNGLPAAAFDKPGAATGRTQPGPGLTKSYVIEADSDADGDGEGRNDATRIGDVAVVSAPCEQPLVEPARASYAAPPAETAPPPDDGPEIPAVHDRLMTHQRTASPMHDVDRSWHEREWSYHDVGRSWHWREGSWHSRQRSWHWRTHSWHDRDQSWHQRQSSWHDRQRSWHWRNQSWHDRQQSWHGRDRSWHERQFSFHDRNRSWHRKGSSGHDRDRSWHWKDQSHHDRAKSWHRRESSSHERDRSWHARDRSWHRKEQSWGGGHIRSRTWHDKGKSFDNDQGHRRDRSRTDNHDRSRSQSFDQRREEQKQRRDRQREETEQRRKDRDQRGDRRRPAGEEAIPEDRRKRLEERRQRNEELKRRQEQQREERRRQEGERKEDRNRQQQDQTREQRRQEQKKQLEERRSREKDAQQEKRNREQQKKEERRKRQQDQRQQLLDQSQQEDEQRRRDRRKQIEQGQERRDNRRQRQDDQGGKQQQRQQKLERQQQKQERQQQKQERQQQKQQRQRQNQDENQNRKRKRQQEEQQD